MLTGVFKTRDQQRFTISEVAADRHEPVVPQEFRPFRSSALSFPGAKSPQRELSLPWNFRSVEHSLHGTFVPRERTFQELSFRGTFAPVELSFLWSERSKNFRSYETRSMRTNIPRTLLQRSKNMIMPMRINHAS